jgi:hypothetical protein
MNKLTPCCQKGYANGRYCQEVLISVIDTIEKCRHLNKKGGVLCLDIKKAFDSLSHSYLKNIFEFYNFGPNISRWLTVLSMNRAARIVLLNDVSTSFFELEQGNAQGDTISPFLFNLVYQILLFKLEYDNQIHSLAKTVLGMRNGSLGKPPLIAEAAASSVLSGRRLYWRGFESDRGSTVRPAGGRGWRGGRRGSSGRDESRPGSSGSGRQRATPYTRPEQSVRGGSMRGTPRGRGRGFSH